MKLQPRLLPATLVRRYKRFLADVVMQNGDTLTVYTPNTGSMLGISEPGTTVWLRDTNNPARKYRYSWEISETPQGEKIGVNTGLVNRLVMEAISNGTIQELQGYNTIQQEVAYGNEKSRIDLFLSNGVSADCYVEIKNVTAADEANAAIFPDAVTTRGQKHIRELIAMATKGYRSVLLFCVQRADVDCMRPADEIDPAYGILLRRAVSEGVEVLAYKATVSPDEIILTTPLQIKT